MTALDVRADAKHGIGIAQDIELSFKGFMFFRKGSDRCCRHTFFEGRDECAWNLLANNSLNAVKVSADNLVDAIAATPFSPASGCNLFATALQCLFPGNGFELAVLADLRGCDSLA